DEARVPLIETVDDQRMKVLPLKSRSILKLVDQIIAIKRSYLFINEGGVAVADHTVEKLWRIRQQHEVVLVLVLLQLPGNVGDQAKNIQVAQRGFCTEGAGIAAIVFGHKPVQARRQIRGGHRCDGFGVLRLLAGPVGPFAEMPSDPVTGGPVPGKAFLEGKLPDKCEKPRILSPAEIGRIPSVFAYPVQDFTGGL